MSLRRVVLVIAVKNDGFNDSKGDILRLRRVVSK